MTPLYDGCDRQSYDDVEKIMFLFKNHLGGGNTFVVQCGGTCCTDVVMIFVMDGAAVAPSSS